MEAMRNSLLISDDISRRQNLSTIVNFLGENCHLVESSKAIELLKIGAEIDGFFTYSALTASIEKCRSFLINNSKKLKKSNKPILFRWLLCESQQIPHVCKLIEQVSLKEANIFILSESGTGNEIIARNIQYMLLRKEESFIPVNCGAIPEERLESEVCDEPTSLRDAYPASTAVNNIAQQEMDWPILMQPGGHLEFFIEQLVAKKAVGDVL
jgi:DNA-binding NtrC family response regulator